MKVTIVSVEGTLEEISQFEERHRFLPAKEDRSGEPMSEASAEGGTDEPGDARARIDRFIESRGRAYPHIQLVRRFIDEVLSWPGTRPMLGRSSRSTDGLTRYLRLHAETNAVGGFVYVYPGNGRLLFRLLAHQAGDATHALPNPERQGDYQVNLYLNSESALEEALELAKWALDRAREA